MPARRRFRIPITGHRAVIVVIAATAALAFGASTSLAATGSVYYDGNLNVGAGHDFFGGTTPPNGSNVGVGYSVMPNLTMGTENTAIGRASLRGDTSGSDDTAIGYFALAANTFGVANTATGSSALAHNTGGQFDTASGYYALRSNTIGTADTATGDHALFSNTNGEENTATGESALAANKSGADNTATGTAALTANTTGDDNTATGRGALSSNTTGHNNVASGNNALLNNTTGSANLALGPGAGMKLTTGSDNIDIANPGAATESGTIRIGSEGKQQTAYLAGVFGKTIGGATKAVVVNKNGRLGTAPAPAAALKSKSQTLGRLRHKVHQQSVELRHQQRTFTRQIQRLREEVQKGG